MATIDKIKDQVEKNGNVLTVTMEQLREAHGAGRLGVHVRSEISQLLAGTVIGHVPRELPSDQHERVQVLQARRIANPQ